MAERRRADMIRMADDFEGAIGEIVETVSSAATELEASATSLTTTAGRSTELATLVEAASEEAAVNVQSVASAAEELTASVNEISRQVQASARMAGEAVEPGRATPMTASVNCRRPPRASATWSSSSIPSRARPICWR